jgi:hypothetical protein
MLTPQFKRIATVRGTSTDHSRARGKPEVSDRADRRRVIPDTIVRFAFDWIAFLSLVA